MEAKDKKIIINAVISDRIISLNPSNEDIFLISVLVGTYYRKKIGILNSAPETMAAAFLWVYSKSNFLWEGNKKWSLQGLSELFKVNPKTAGDVASKIINSLKIDLWDKRFCRQDVIRGNPFDKFIMSESGFIVPKEMLETVQHYSNKQSNVKENYFDKAMDYLEQDEEEKAIEYLNKSLVLDENYIEGINELGLIYFYKDLEKSKEYYSKAVELSKKELGGNWPKELEWGIWENRPYLWAIQGLALLFWREYEIEKAKELFILLLNLNPGDNQGIRYCLAAIYKGLTWEDFGKIENKCTETGDYDDLDKIVNEQNKFYKFLGDPEGKNEQ